GGSGSVKFREAGYIFAYEDVRGRYMSEGDYVNVWPAVTAFPPPPNPLLQDKPLGGGGKLVDESTDTWDTVDFLVKNVRDNTGALPNFDKMHYKGQVPYWNELMDHGNYDEYWKARSLPLHMKNVKCAVLTVGGWFDAEDMWGALNLYKATEKMNRGTPNFLVM